MTRLTKGGRPFIKVPVVVSLPNDYVRELRLMANGDYVSVGAEVRKLVMKAVDEWRGDTPLHDD